MSNAPKLPEDGGLKPALNWPWPAEFDAVQAAPLHHRVLFENDRVRVLDTRVRAGETVPLHTHRWAAVLQLVSWSDFVRRDRDGLAIVDTRGRPPPGPLPTSVWSEPLPPHTLENVGNGELHVVSIELKDRSEQKRPRSMSAGVGVPSG